MNTRTEYQAPSTKYGVRRPIETAVPLLLAAVLLLAGCGQRASADPVPPRAEAAIPVVMAPVTDTLLAEPVVASGVLAAKEEVPLGFKIGGVVSRIHVDEGETVRAGQLLAELEQPEILAEVDKAEAGLAQAERDLGRATALYQDSVISRDRFEAAGTAAQVAAANLRIARFNLRYAAIRAPGSGVILRRLVEPGQQLPGGTPVLLLASRARGQVIRVGLADREVVRVRIGDRASVRFDADTGAALSGRVTQIAAQAAPGTGTWSVEVRLDRAGPVVSGLIGRVEIRPARAVRARLVPLASLLEADGDSAVIYSAAHRPAAAGTEPAPLADLVARRHRVRFGLLQGDQAAISAGLDGVDQVVTAGAPYLRDGVLVSVFTEAGQGQAAATGGSR